jgi:hypothetical protein
MNVPAEHFNRRSKVLDRMRQLHKKALERRRQLDQQQQKSQRPAAPPPAQ